MPKGYFHLTRDIRCQIYTLKSTGLSLREIGKKLMLNVSTISREIKRNKGERGYRFQQANQKAQERRSLASEAPKKLTDSFKQEIEAKLREDWSPEQISGRFKLEGHTISHESIYRHICLNSK